MQFLDPTSTASSGNLRARTLSTLNGARLAFLSNGWNSIKEIGKHIKVPLQSIYGVSEFHFHDIPRNAEPPKGLIDRLLTECDVAIVGIANCGSCTSWAVHNTAQLIKKGIPAVVVVSEQFDKLARTVMRSHQLDESIEILIKGNPETIPESELAKVAADVLNQAVDRLTRQRSAATPDAKEVVAN